MKLYLTGNPCDQVRHCYFVEGEKTSFILDCGYQRCYEDDELPHIDVDQIRRADYLFLTHSHENQSGALSWLYQNGFNGRVVTTTETARQLSFPADDPLILEGLSLPYEEAELPGGLRLTWGRSGHCSGSAWFRMSEGGHSIFFSGDYYDCPRVHCCDLIEGITADLAVLDCEYGAQTSSNSRKEQVSQLIGAITDALADGRPVLLPVPRYGRGQGILTYINEYLPDTDVFADRHFISEIGHLDANAMWVKPELSEMLSYVYVRSIPKEFIALGIYFISDPQLDLPESRKLVQRLLVCGGRVILTGTVEPRTHAAVLLGAGKAQQIRYGVHCTQGDMLRVASQNHFSRIIAYNSDYAPTQSVYEV